MPCGSGSKPDHNLHHDNMWCDNAPDTIAFMATLKKPSIAFKVLAAGAIHPRLALQWAFEVGRTSFASACSISKWSRIPPLRSARWPR